ncbi:hypothetical protein ACOSQ2_003714 [Xanthoceras sorbifolium]
MGGGAMNMDFPMIEFRASSSANPPFFSSSASASNYTVPLKKSWTTTTSASSHETCKKVESVDRREDRRASGSSDISVFGSVPSKFEVENAIAALQNFMHRITSSGPVFESWDLKTLISQGYGKICDTFRLLQTDPSVKRLVVSLASDRAIWDAIMNNELVRNLHESPYPGEKGKYQSSEEEPNLAADLLKWILDTTKAKIMELIAKFQVLMNEVLQSLDRDKESTEETRVKLEDKVRSSLLLSVVILLIVIVSRAHRA